ncbi:hypothetical protein [Halopiger xanaduensis]|uniref:Uncharacterized protein n=1 Tax=Halopiger xanaduensis (strain DSM 18323 / JCM 14033 / SH-6) TaxID=797210 RepID=F8DCA7_HALXS|nr:hypothetical protein [Halopiger xanaduensis]AEH38364.1 hypothetical protein Halxa_3758 [Halopiger xanaduensis SH-6]
MADLLYSIYAVAVLVVAVGGLVGVAFGTPSGGGTAGRNYRYDALVIVAALFIAALIAEFLL